MKKPHNKGAMINAALPQISPIHIREIAVKAEHYRTMTAFVRAQMKKDVDTGGLK